MVPVDYQNRLIQVKIIHQLRLLWEVLSLDEHILEEADTYHHRYTSNLCSQGRKETCVAVVADDTDVYMLYHYQAELLTVSMRLLTINTVWKSCY